MKKATSAIKAQKRLQSQSPLKFSWKSNMVGSRKPAKRKDLLKDVLDFHWLKKAMVGKTQEESLDLLDQWILKKRHWAFFSNCGNPGKIGP